MTGSRGWRVSPGKDRLKRQGNGPSAADREDDMADSAGFAPDAPIRCRRFRIGCIGAGFIMADIHLAAYAGAGFPVVAIASRTREKAAEVAARWKIATVHDNPQALIEDAQVEILDIAFPPDQQPDLIRQALKQRHIKAILAQKPLAMNFEIARAVAAEAKAAGKILSVNQNMRFDQSIRVLKQLLERGDLGAPVLATIEMRAIPHWQPFLKDYGRLTLLNMSIHHLDALRFLFGDPESITTIARTDPRTGFAHKDGITISSLRFPGGLIALSMEDVWAGPASKRAAAATYSSNGGWREPKAWPAAPSAGRTILTEARRHCATPPDRRAANGSRQAGRPNGSRTPSPG